MARALALRPKVLLLDEPTAGMNPRESATFTEFVHRVRDEKKVSVLLIEHDMSVVMRVSERITVLDRGEKIAEGGPDEIRSNQRVIEAYLGNTLAYRHRARAARPCRLQTLLARLVLPRRDLFDQHGPTRIPRAVAGGSGGPRAEAGLRYMT